MVLARTNVPTPPFLENLMTATAPREYDLVFHAYDIGPATVVSYLIPSRQPMPSLNFGKGDKIHIRVIGPDESPTSMESVTIKFKVQSGPPGPLGDGTKSSFVWKVGDRDTHTVHASGKWKFGAVLTAKDKRQYTLPDPEFQVGDGG